MKLFKQLLLIFSFTLVGTLISYLLSLASFPFPGSLIGMILLFIFLLFGLVKVDSIHGVAQFFIDNMGIFFVPAAIASLKQIEIISAHWWKLLIILFAAFVISFTCTYWAVKLTLHLQHKGKKEAIVEQEANHD
ncbi:MAG: CidA/LrgA family protein [Bacilli bacterium]|nr:CidA/LrgA family protein [Bacilli bacterium]